MYATLSRRLSSRITSSPTRSLAISFSPVASKRSSIFLMASSTASAETGRLRKAMPIEPTILLRLYSTRLAFFLTIAGSANSGRS